MTDHDDAGSISLAERISNARVRRDELLGETREIVDRLEEIRVELVELGSSIGAPFISYPTRAFGLAQIVETGGVVWP